MLSAFGVDHGTVSKAEERTHIPDWASGAIPASTVHAYSRSKKHKAEAAARNFAWTSAGSAAGTLVGAGLVGLAFKKVKKKPWMPKTFYRTSEVKNPLTGKKTKIPSGEKQRYAGMSVGGTLGALGGGIAGATHLKRMKNQSKYKYEEPKK